MLKVRVLGPLRVQLDGRPLALARGRRVPELLGWLALHPGLHPRWQVAAVFWPDVADATARNNLRQIAWDLRRSLGPAADRIKGSREHLGLVPRPDLWVDAWAFDAAADAGRWAEAAALPAGEVLEGFDAPWLDEERPRRRQRLAEVLTGLTDAQCRGGDAASAVATARRLLELDPYDERALRLLLVRLEAVGRRAEAVAAGDAFAARLLAELGIAPSRATREALDRLRREPVPAACALSRPTRAVLPPATGGFVARVAELDALQDLLRRTRTGGQLIVGVEGDAGIGKTALAAEFAARAERAGALVLAGRSTEDQLLAYQPWVEALRNHAEAHGAAALRRELPNSARHLLPLLPELREVLGVEASPAATAPPDRFRMFQAVADWLQALAARQPILLVLDDLHAADAASLELLRHLAASPAPGPVLVLFTCRPRAENASSQFVATLAECSRFRLSWLRLRGLQESDLGDLVAAVTARRASAEFVRALHRRTTGNPFFATEVLRSLGDAGTPGVRGGEWTEAEAAEAVAVPEGVRHVLGRRLARLPEPSRRAVEVGSVLGMEFAAAAAGAALRLPRPDLLDPLDAAVAAGLLVEHGGPGGYAFAHPLVREVVYTGLSGNRRAWLHERAGDALAAVGAPPAVVARHLLDAGTEEAAGRAARHAVVGAARLLEQGAWEEARALLERMLAYRGLAGEQRSRLWSLHALALHAEWQLIAENRRVSYSRVVPDASPNSGGGAGTSAAGMSEGATSPAIS